MMGVDIFLFCNVMSVDVSLVWVLFNECGYYSCLSFTPFSPCLLIVNSLSGKSFPRNPVKCFPWTFVHFGACMEGRGKQGNGWV